MRIIGGNFKGKKILEPKDKETRPLKDLTKESIFNIINHSNKFTIDLEKSYVLDLFSGTGSFGLECLSRGAKKVYFIEKNPKAIDNLKLNIENLNVEKNTIVHLSDVIYFLSKNKSLDLKFNLIFCDPPYKDTNIEKLIKLIFDKNLIIKNGIIIIHRNKNTKEKFPHHFEILEERVYGISKIIFGKFLS